MHNHDWAQAPHGLAAVNYARMIIDRVRSGMPNDGFTVDWDNAPLTVSDHRGAQLRLIDPVGVRSAAAPLSGTITEVCLSTYGITGARLTVNLNDRPEVHTRVSGVKWGRGAASGGGRYCANIYLVHGGDELLEAGVYAYSVIANGWERLQRHDRTAEIRSLQRHPFRAASYVILTINYWRSAFKYNDFAYQATSMDIGTFAGAEFEVLGAAAADTWDMDVDETGIARVLGIDPRDEGVYAVQAWGSRDADPVAGVAAVEPRPEPLATHQRDRGLVRFDTTEALQRDMHAEGPGHSTGTSLRPVLAGRIPDRREPGRRRLLMRETSFGRFSGESVSLGVLRALMARGSAVAGTVFAASRPPELAYLVYVNAVDGLEQGLYLQRGGTFELLDPGDQSAFLESTYFLQNYMGRRAACTVIVCAAVIAAAGGSGVRGYRLTNAMVGAACQALLTEANHSGVGTGTALGFDAAAHAEHAGLDPEELAPMLMIMLGVDEPVSARVHAHTTGEASA